MTKKIIFIPQYCFTANSPPNATDENSDANCHFSLSAIWSNSSRFDSMMIDAQKRAAREGFDMDIIPTDIATYAGEAKNILRDLQSRNEQMFLVTFLLVNMADSKRKLDNDISRASSVAQKYNCQLTRLDFQQEQGFVSALPLGVNQIKIQRGLTTSALAIMMPFTTQEIFQDGDALYYGLNATSGNMILADRKQNKTPNGLILGTPGSGKSFSAKRSILNMFLITRDDIIICDPESYSVGNQKKLLTKAAKDLGYSNKMSQRYEAEQAELAEKIKLLHHEIDKLSSSSVSTDLFLSTVRKYTRAKKLTPRMLNELINRIEVHQAEKINGEWIQRLTIHYNCIGALFIPDTEPLPAPNVTVNTRRGVYVTYEPAQNE